MAVADPDSNTDPAARDAARAVILEKIQSLSTDVPDLKIELVSLTAANKKLAESNERSKKWMLSLSAIAMVLVLTVTGVIVALVRQDRVSARVDTAVDYNVASCFSSNATRAEAKSLWDSVVQLLQQPADGSTKKPSPGLTTFTNALQDRVNHVYAQRDCSPVRNGSPAPAILPVSPPPTKK